MNTKKLYILRFTCFFLSCSLTAMEKKYSLQRLVVLEDPYKENKQYTNLYRHYSFKNFSCNNNGQIGFSTKISYKEKSFLNFIIPGYDEAYGNKVSSLKCYYVLSIQDKALTLVNNNKDSIKSVKNYYKLDEPLQDRSSVILYRGDAAKSIVRFINPSHEEWDDIIDNGVIHVCGEDLNEGIMLGYIKNFFLGRLFYVWKLTSKHNSKKAYKTIVYIPELTQYVVHDLDIETTLLLNKGQQALLFLRDGTLLSLDFS